jgi:CRP-like cAMP-binding protein
MKKNLESDSYQSSNSAAACLTLFDKWTELNFNKLKDYAETIEFMPGQLIVNTGDIDDAVYLVSAGQVEVTMMNAFGFTKRVATIEKGSVFGEVAFFDNDPRSASVRALNNGQVLRISRDNFSRLAKSYPELGQKFLLDLGRILAYRFRSGSPFKL